MTDNDDAEIDLVQNVYPESSHILCWLHVLKNWKNDMRLKLPAEKNELIFPKLKNLLMKSLNKRK